MTRPLLYDVCCGAGGAAKGYQRAGFRVIGIDIKPQPRYCGDGFIQMDALEFLRRYLSGEFEGADAFHASPPCQFGSEATLVEYRANHPNLIPAVRELLRQTGRPYVIENVEAVRGHLINPVLLCGTMFGLPIERHRYFEIYPARMLLVPPCRHERGWKEIDGRTVQLPVLCTGGGDGQRANRKTHRPRGKVTDIRWAMDIDWMVQGELTEAIPPAFTEFTGAQLLAALEQERAA